MANINSTKNIVDTSTSPTLGDDRYPTAPLAQSPFSFADDTQSVPSNDNSAGTSLSLGDTKKEQLLNKKQAAFNEFAEQNPATSTKPRITEYPEPKPTKTSSKFSVAKANVFDTVTQPSASSEVDLTGGNINNSTETPVPTTMEKDAAEKASLQHGSDVLTARQNLQQNASTIKQNLNDSQQQADMMQYQNNQSAEKVGWTGGYVLDQNRQMDYLKASLAAQMYGAIELQKYGYDTSLAAARLSYDLNQKEYARQYYQDAVNKALNEAQVTGVYISAEIQDMLNQRTIAQKALEDEGYEYNAETGKWLRDGQEPDSADYQLIKTINDWFASNGITEVGQKTLAAIQAENTDALNWHTQLWTEYNAALQAAKADIDDNPTVFLMYEKANENDTVGKIAYTGTNDPNNPTIESEVRTIDLSGLSNKELKEYADTCSKAKEQVSSYINYLKEQAYAKTALTNSEGKVTGYDQEQLTKELNSVEEKVKAIGIDIDTTDNDKGLSITKDENGTIVISGTGQQPADKPNLYVQGLGNGRINDDVDITFGSTERDKQKEYDLIITQHITPNTALAKALNKYITGSENGTPKDGDIGLNEDSLYIYSIKQGKWCKLDVDNTKSGITIEDAVFEYKQAQGIPTNKTVNETNGLVLGSDGAYYTLGIEITNMEKELKKNYIDLDENGNIPEGTMLQLSGVYKEIKIGDETFANRDTGTAIYHNNKWYFIQKK